MGGKYKLRTLWVLIKGPVRYGVIRRSLVVACQGRPVTPRILSRELKELQARLLIQRHQINTKPPHVEYSLTELGTRVIPIIKRIIKWGRTGAHEVLPRRAVHSNGRAAAS